MRRGQTQKRVNSRTRVARKAGSWNMFHKFSVVFFFSIQPREQWDNTTYYLTILLSGLGEPSKLIVPRLTSISPRHISGFQTLSPYYSGQGIIIVRSQIFSQFRVIIPLFEMINELRLKTEPYRYRHANYIIRNVWSLQHK